MYIVNIEGDDPFVARTKPAIERGLDDLYDGEVVSKSVTKGCVRILYKDNCEQELNVVAYYSEVYR